MGGLSTSELQATFAEWNRGELSSFLVEITAAILAREDDQKPGGGPLVELIKDKTGMKGTGKWTVQQGAELSVAAPTIAASLDARCMSALLEERKAAAALLEAAGVAAPGPVKGVDKKQLIEDVRQAGAAACLFHEVTAARLRVPVRLRCITRHWALRQLCSDRPAAPTSLLRNI